MIRDRLVWRMTVALVLLLMIAVVSVVSYTQGTAPEIAFAGFSSEIDADGVPNYGYISFKDLDKDLSQVRFEVVAGQGSNLVIDPGWQFDPDMQGESSGTLQFTIATQAPGQYELRLILMDAMGNESVPEVIAFVAKDGVSNLPPVAAFSVSPATAKVGESIIFDASASSDADGTIASFEWDFGDGSTAQGQQVTHAYDVEGSHDVSLTVTDDAGDLDVSTQGVSIYSEMGCTPMACFSLNNSATDRESVEEVIHVGADELLILDGTCSTCTESHFVSVQRSDQWWNQHGPEASGWLTPDEEADIGGLDVRAFAARHGVVMQPNTYYRVGLAVAEPWDSVTRLVFINPATGAGNAWVDDFDSPVLDSRWGWIREDTSLWSLDANSGVLRLRTHAGSLLYDNDNARNLLLQDAPDGEFMIETHVMFTPLNNFQIAGLLIYLDDNHFLMLGRAYCDVTANGCVGNAIYFDYEEGLLTLNHVLSTSQMNEAYLRVVREGTRYTGYYSIDGQTWQEVGSFRTFSLNTSAVRVGLVACGDTDSGSVAALFGYFALTSGAQ